MKDQTDYEKKLRLQAQSKRITDGVIAVPSLNLIPSKTSKVRDIDESFVETLKSSMLSEPFASYVPLQVNVRTNHKENEILANLENYEFEVIGGNHTRTALHEILAKYPDHSVFKIRLCEVVRNLEEGISHEPRL